MANFVAALSLRRVWSIISVRWLLFYYANCRVWSAAKFFISLRQHYGAVLFGEFIRIVSTNLRLAVASV